MSQTVLVTIPYYGCADTIERAVDSVLNQTYRDVFVLVLNDADDFEPLFRMMHSRKSDNRLAVHTMARNRGRYFADAVALAASPFPYYCVQDADDESHAGRIGYSIKTMDREKTDVAFSAQELVKVDGKVVIEDRHDKFTAPAGPKIDHIAQHHAVYKTEALRKVGGHHPGFRVGYDTLLVNLVRATSPCSYVRDPIYRRIRRNGSLSKGSDTQWGSPVRLAAIEQIKALYATSRRRKADGIRQMVEDDIGEVTRRDVAEEAHKLKENLWW